MFETTNQVLYAISIHGVWILQAWCMQQFHPSKHDAIVIISLAQYTYSPTAPWHQLLSPPCAALSHTQSWQWCLTPTSATCRHPNGLVYWRFNPQNRWWIGSIFGLSWSINWNKKPKRAWNLIAVGVHKGPTHNIPSCWWLPTWCGCIPQWLLLPTISWTVFPVAGTSCLLESACL